MSASLTTTRLELVPMTLSLAAAEREGVDALAAALDAAVAPEWPPELYETDDRERMERLLRDDRNAGWTLYYLIRRMPVRMVVGVAGFSGCPTSAGVVEIGYGIVPAHRLLGLASEAVAALLEFAFRDPRVAVVVAETFPNLPASIGVLLRAGFRLLPDAGRGGTLRYERTRSTPAAG